MSLAIPHNEMIFKGTQGSCNKIEAMKSDGNFLFTEKKNHSDMFEVITQMKLNYILG